MSVDLKEFKEQNYDGYTIPVVKHDGYKRIYDGTPFADWGDFELDFSGTYATNGEKRLFSSTVRRLIQEQDADFIEAFARMKYVPNGQLKNFLVACRTFYSLGPSFHVAVVGSKSQEGSGSWHKYLAYFLSEGRKEVSIDFIDPNEIENQWTCDINGCSITCRWIPDAVESGMVSGYDAVSSDVWSYDQKTSWGVPDVPVYSLKGGHADYVPYLHYSETRLFSNPPSAFAVKCPCMVCQACSKCVTNWCSFVFLRTLSARLGCPSRCRGIKWVYDQNALSEIRQEILTGAGVDRLPSNYRYILALSTEEAIQMGERTFIRGNKIRRLDPRTSEVKLIRQDVFTGLEGKNIAFVGVSPTVLGSTPCHAFDLSNSHRAFTDYDVMFVSNVSSWLLSFKSDMVFCPDRPDIIEKVLVDWKWTGHMISEFYQYVMVTAPIQPVRKDKLDGEGRVVSLKVNRSRLTLVEYDGTNPVYSSGHSYIPIKAMRSPLYDTRSIFSGVFYAFENVESFWLSIQKLRPSFTLEDLRSLQKNFSLLHKIPWSYKSRVKIKVVGLTGTIEFEGSCVLDYFRQRGLILKYPGKHLGMLTPLFPGQYYAV